jgi:hypothetical protein
LISPEKGKHISQQRHGDRGKKTVSPQRHEDTENNKKKFTTEARRHKVKEKEKSGS